MNKTLARWKNVEPATVTTQASRGALFYLVDDAKADILALGAIVERVARLNPDAGEIGAGMLKQLVTEARSVLGE